MSSSIRMDLGLMALALALAGDAAMADVVAVVSSKSAIAALSKSEVADIFYGKTTHVANGALVVPIDQVEGSPVRDEFYRKVAGKSAAQMKEYWSKIIFTGRGQPPKEAPNSIEVKKRIIESPAAIGYIELNMVDPSVRVVPVQ